MFSVNLLNDSTAQRGTPFKVLIADKYSTLHD